MRKTCFHNSIFIAKLLKKHFKLVINREHKDWHDKYHVFSFDSINSKTFLLPYSENLVSVKFSQMFQVYLYQRLLCVCVCVCVCVCDIQPFVCNYSWLIIAKHYFYIKLKECLFKYFFQQNRSFIYFYLIFYPSLLITLDNILWLQSIRFHYRSFQMICCLF